MFPSNKNPYPTNASSHSFAYNYPDLSFSNITNSSINNITNTIYHCYEIVLLLIISLSSNYNNIDMNNSTNPITPLFAERNRNIDLDSSYNRITPLSPSSLYPLTMDNSSSNIVNLDIEAIAEKVYQILHRQD